MSNVKFDDSGHRALVGFFYQSVQTAGLVVEVDVGLQRDGDRYEIVTVVRPEEFGQDAVRLTDSGTEVRAKVVQHKFSENPQDNAIEPSELFEIIEKLNNTAQHVVEKYSCTVETCLQTNRPLSSESQEIFDAAKNGTAQTKLDGKDLKFRRWLKQLSYDSRTFAKAVEALTNRAKAFGVLDAEVQQRLPAIEGELFGAISRNTARQVTLANLDSWLTQDEHPRQLCCPSTSQVMADKLNDLFPIRPDDDPLLPRSALSALQSCFEKPLIHIFGDGGVGKTAIAMQYLRSILRDTPPPFVGATHIIDIDERWVGSLYTTWRNSRNDNLTKESLDTLINRLELSVSAPQRPMLFLLVDGIDERDREQARHPLRQLVHFMTAERRRSGNVGALPRAQLIVTSRGKADFHNWILDDPFNDDLTATEPVEVQIYSNDELSSISSEHLPPDMARRIAATLDVYGQRTETRFSSSAASDLRPIGTLSFDILEALRHPPLLAALRRVARVSPETGLAMLDGDSAACGEVSRHYLVWFANKVLRRQWFQNYNMDDVFDLLHVVLLAVGSEPTFRTYRESWENPLKGYGATLFEAKHLFRESLSAGLVLQESQERWQWRNAFVCRGIAAHRPNGGAT
jgi:hypothetical protein